MIHWPSCTFHNKSYDMDTIANQANTGSLQDGQRTRLSSTMRCLYSHRTPSRTLEHPLVKNRVSYKLRRLSSDSTRRGRPHGRVAKPSLCHNRSGEAKPLSQLREAAEKRS